MQQPWKKQYDTGVPSSLAPYPTHPLHDFLTQSAKRVPENTAVVTSAHIPVAGRLKSELKYKDLEAQANALAAALAGMGVRKGDRVAIIMPNCAQFVIAFYAILKAGAIVCATNPTYPGPKLRDQLKDAGATVAIVLSKFYSVLKEVQAETDVKHVIVTNIKEYLPGVASLLFTVAKEKKDGHRIEKDPKDHDFQALLKQYAGQSVNVPVEPQDVAIFQYTGGTTGVPKAAMGTHAALVANTLQCKSWLTTGNKPEDEVFMAAIPLFHVYGLVSVLSFGIGIGAKLLMVANPREIKEVLEVIEAYHPTLYNGVPAMYNALNVHPDVLAGKYNLKSIRACVSGSAPLPPATKRKFEELTGGKLVEGFGMSETPTAAIVNPLNGQVRAGSIGLPIPDVDARIVSLEDGKTEVPVGEVGELIVKGPQLFSGYWNMPTETNNALRVWNDGEKWLFTGDIARMDEDGFFYIVDRKKDMAIIGGFNVYPTNIEKVLMEHPAVQEAAVAAVSHPDKPGQEALKAWVMVKPGQNVSPEELIKFAETRMARYEVPTRIEIAQDLPRTTVGKVLRRELVQAEMAKREKDAAKA
jgi:long-chain acyl-CoA synthetase